MKKALLFAMSALLSVNTLGFATANPVEIQKVTIENGVVEVKVTNTAEENRQVTMTAVKDGASTLSDRVYALVEETVEASKEETFTFEILDQDPLLGRGSGDYTIKVSDGNIGTVADVYQFAYADSAEVDAFLQALKTRAGEVTVPDEAYLKLQDLMVPGNDGVFFVTGVDYALYSGASAQLQQETLNSLYKNGIASLTKETLPDAFKGAFGLATYNTGDSKGGVNILAPKYNGESIDDAICDAALLLMENSYDTIENFRTSFLLSYGLVTVNNARVGTMDQTLSAFHSVTGQCGDKIAKLRGLYETYKLNAYEYMVTSLRNTPVTTTNALGTLLDEAYNYSGTGNDGTTGGGISGGIGSFGGGGGGGGFGITGIEKPETEQNTQPGQSTKIFTDLTTNHWAAESVKWLKNKGIVSGTETGAFEPDRTVTREEFTKMIALACGLEINSQSVSFGDIQADAWYASYIGAAVDAGIVSGIGGNHFGIGQNITRQDMAVMVKRAFESKGISLVKVKNYTAFDDEGSFADYAEDAIKALFEAGIINGKGANHFAPVGNATRAEAAKIIYEAFKGGI